MIDLTPILKAVLTLVLSLVAVYVIPYIKTKLGVEQFAKVQMWVNIAVEAAEMIYAGVGRGEEKKAYVVAFLENKGFTLKPEELDAIIEAAVLELKKKED